VYIATKQAHFYEKQTRYINKQNTKFAHMSSNKAICPHRMAADPAQKLITTTIIKTKNLHTKITMKIKQEIETYTKTRPTNTKPRPTKTIKKFNCRRHQKRKPTSNTKTRPTETINPYNCRKQQDKQTYIKYQTSPNKNN
jgi:hypothetical protein